MPVFKASKILRKEQEAGDTLSMFCYHFPQYTYAQAKELPFKRIKVMLKAARKEQAKQMLDFANAMAGSRSKKGLDNVLSYFKSIIDEE